MSAALDYAAGDPYYTESVGPQSDGTYTYPASYGTLQPVDAGGGAPANYSTAVLDVFKYGVGAWAQYKTNEQLLDYRRWEATNFGTTMQGRPAVGVGVTANGNGGGMLLLLGAAVVLVLVLKK